MANYICMYVIIYIHETTEFKKVYKKAIPKNLWCLIVKTKQLRIENLAQLIDHQVAVVLIFLTI